MKSAGWPAPAKLNLMLRVLGRRDDGYHELQTVFRLIDFTDRLAFSPRADATIRRIAGPASVPAESDLCVRAARLLQAESGLRVGVDIELVKQVPIQGGLGGGSSDAATTLVALNEIWSLDRAPEELGRLGLSLGADVPLFIHGHSAWAEGVGERLTPLMLPPRWYAIVYPGIGIRTAEVFQSPELTRNSPKTTIRGFLMAGGPNDCTSVAAGRVAEIRQALHWLGRRGEARLTGTGSCVFAEFADRQQAEAALAELPGPWSGYVVRGLDHSPLQQRLAAERALRSGRDR